RGASIFYDYLDDEADPTLPRYGTDLVQVSSDTRVILIFTLKNECKSHIVVRQGQSSLASQIYIYVPQESRTCFWSHLLHSPWCGGGAGTVAPGVGARSGASGECFGRTGVASEHAVFSNRRRHRRSDAPTATQNRVPTNL